MEKIKIDIIVSSSVIYFGKYKGKTFEWVCSNNPQYILWIQKNSIQNICFHPDFIVQAYQNLFRIKEFEHEMLENSESIY